MENREFNTKLLFFKRSMKVKLLSVLVLVITSDFLFFDHKMGWTIGAFGLVLVGVFCAHNSNLLKSRDAQILLGLTLGQCFLQIEKQSLLSFTLMALGLISLTLLRREDWRGDAAIWLRFCLSFVLRFMRPLNRARVGYQRYFQKYTSQNVFLTFIRGWFLPTIFSLVFLYLLSNANPIMKGFLDKVDFIWLFANLSIGRIIFWLAMAGFIFSIIRPRLKIRTRNKKKRIFLSQEKAEGFTEWAFSKDAVLRSLFIFNLMFALQTAMDMNYLLMGSALPEGLSYAKYAHKGAYPLILTALLAAAFVLIIQDSKKEISKSKLVIQLTYLWVMQNVLLVFFSIYRTALYVEIYALTYWRIAAFIWMGLVACGLVWIVLRGVFRKSNTWLINANILTLLTVLYVTSFINIGGIIAHYNVAHLQNASGQDVAFDVRYLRGIGAVAIPAMSKLKQDQSIPLEHMKCDLKRDMDNWRRWTYSEHRLRALFNNCWFDINAKKVERK